MDSVKHLLNIDKLANLGYSVLVMKKGRNNRNPGPRPAYSQFQTVPERVRQLSPRRQEVIRPALEHARDYVLLSVRGLARRLNTDPATLLRILRGMGFEGYREFQQYLHELSIAQATPLDLMQTTATRDSNIPAHVLESFDRDLKNLQALRHTLDSKRVAALAGRLHTARRILILGGDLAANLANFLAYNLTVLGLPALTGLTPGQVVHFARNVGEEDLVIAISFRRGLRQTVEGVQEARARGAYCVGITDTYISPIARFANECFLASIESPSFGGSYAAPMALLNVILVACANYQRAHTISLLKEAEKEQRTGFRWYREE